MNELIIGVDSPTTPDVQALLGRHLAFARDTSPPEDVHALDVDGLQAETVFFFSVRADGELLAIGALKQVDERHGEIKSMHTAQEARGRGVARALLDHLLQVARDRGCVRVSLETGAMKEFAPARGLYAAAGFEPCAPFADYEPSRHSTFMTLELDSAPTALG